MPRDLVIGNGSLLISFDSQYRLADFYFPHVGMENHAASRFRFGVWSDGALQWVDEAPWRRQLTYLRDTLVTDVICENAELGLRLRCYDTVDVDRDAYVRKIVVRNQRDEKRTVKLFLHHDFNIYGNPIADTAFFDPASGAIIHYKAKRYFLINVDGGIAEYACGRTGMTGGDGTWRDAEDGALSMTAIAQGSVDSTIAVTVELEPMASTTVLYWICAGHRYGEVRALDRQVRFETPARVMARTASYWYTWVNKNGESLGDLPDDIVDLYRRSLLIVSTQCDRGGAVIAANDSDIQLGHNDHYSYMWPRDAVFVCDAMDRAGYPEFARRFLTFANRIIKDEGYFLHKYNADGSLASLWHPWVRDGLAQLPIQEDETALVVWLVARHYDRTRDLDFLRSIYDRLVVRIADFLVHFRDPATSLPLPSFDLWEERQGVFTFTACAVVAGLTAAAELANLFNDSERRERYTAAASSMRDAIVEHLWLPNEKRFARGRLVSGEIDATVDASLFGTFYLGVFPPGSALVEGSLDAVRESLRVDTEVGGFARYPGDDYHRISEETDRVPGNPWIIITLWIAEHAVAAARDADELHAALQHLFWVRSKALGSLVLPEQLNPYDGSALSVAPLTWSHAQFVSVVRAYLTSLAKWRTADPVDNP
jgi:glucoamylase